MNRRLWLAAACAAAGLTCACGSPAAPGPLQQPDAGSGPGGSTLKAAAPSAVSPRNNVVVANVTPILVVNNSRGLFTPGLPLMLVFVVYDEANTAVYRSAPVAQQPGNQTVHVVTVPLAAGRPYSWHAIPIFDGREGPPSLWATFRTP